MILHVILISALSASAGAPVDSVRSAQKQGVARPDSVLLTLPAPTIKAPTPPEPRIAGLVTLAWPTKKTVAVASAEPAKPSAEPVKPSNQMVVQTISHVAVQSTVSSGAQSSARPAAVDVVQQAVAVPQAVAVAPATVMQPAPVATQPTAVAVAAAAPADASAVALPARTSASAAPAAPITTSDGRLVLSTRSTVTMEPMHAVPLPAAGLRLAPPALADSIVVYKREHTLTLFLRGVPVRSYFVALGSRPVGDKVSAGDDRTPEGVFSIIAHNPASKYHLGLRISYPDAFHRDRAAKLGVDPGGDIMIHGLPLKYSNAGKDHRLDDWTNGCVALTNEEIEEIWHAVPDGTPVQIKP